MLVVGHAHQVAIIQRYTSVPHLEAMSHMQEVLEKAIVHFDQLSAVAPQTNVADVQFLVAHEQVL